MPEKMTPSQIRKKFIDFFVRNGHEHVSSSPVIPAQDPTLLFANAGMNQFKDIFLGKESRSYSRAVTAQKCVRAGGKHNDLDQVGFTARHLTFFQMLGNFSFGDYFKKEAIRFAWDFLTKDLGLDPARMSVTVYLTDDDAEQIWINDIGLSKDKITRMGDEDNFWQMGDTGPCGPCSEIFYDRGPEFDSQGHDERFIEVWNMVFIQYDRQEDGELKPLPKTGIDTGMGFERLVSVLSGAESIFKTEVFEPLRTFIETKSGIKYVDSDEKTQAAFNVLCDHIRSSSFIIADGQKPSNDGRGYVLRKIIRRALMFAKKLSKSKDLFASLVPVLCEQMGSDFPELVDKKSNVEKILTDETDRFFSNLEKGERIFATYAKEPQTLESKKISGEKAFKLYDTYGFPVEITRIMAMEQGLDVDMDGFAACMETQKEQSGKTKKVKESLDLPEGLAGQFVGYEQTSAKSKINWLGEPKDSKIWASTEQNPFFASRGGQVSDVGYVQVGEDKFNVCQVRELATSPTTKTVVVQLSGNVDKLSVGQEVVLQVDEAKRRDTERNHSGTHLIHAALRKVLGPHATQAGSVVDPDYLRFDFNHDKALTAEEIEAAEKQVNDWIQEDCPSKIFETDMDEAVRLGADAIFGEKYNPEKVRVIDFPGQSIELCGGTHLASTGQIGSFKIISEESLGIGVRRIFALTGPKAFELFQQAHTGIKALAQKYACKPEQVLDCAQKTMDKLEAKTKELDKLKLKLASLEAQSLKDKFKSLGSVNFLFAKFDSSFAASLREICQGLVGQPASIALCLSPLEGQKVSFVLGLSKDLEGKVDLKAVSKGLASLGLRGGGKGQFIQGGGVAGDLTALETGVENLIQSIV